jgi:segregation and condensation protein B
MSTQAAEILMDTDEDVAPEPSTNGASAMHDAAPDETVEATETAEVEDVGRLAPLLEGLLFAAGGPVPIARLVEALDGPDRREVLRALALLGERLEAEGRGLRLVRIAGGYQLRTLAEHGPWVRRLLGGKPPRLSRAMLETLAIIAYRQPATKPEIEAIRGVDVDAVLSTLLERRMIRIVGRKEAPGRPILYGTTKDFLEVFSLPDLEALPPLRDLGDLAEALARQDAAADGGARPIETAAEAASADAAEGAPAAPEDRGADEAVALGD